MTDFATYASYTDLVDAAMKGQAGENDLCAWLRAKSARNGAEADILKAGRRKHPGRTDAELLKPYASYLEKQFPVYRWSQA